MNACYLPDRESETDPARTLGLSDGLGLASGGGGHVDVIERADESGERLHAELGADRPARVRCRQSGGSRPYGGIKAGRRMCESRVTASGNG